METKTVYVPVKTSERNPTNKGRVYHVRTRFRSGYKIQAGYFNLLSGRWDVKDVEEWLEPTEAIILSKEDAEKMDRLLKIVANCQSRNALEFTKEAARQALQLLKK